MDQFKQERLMAQGRRAELNHKIKEWELEAKALVASIRGNLSPLEADVTKLKTAQAAQSAKRLDEVVKKIREAKIEIAKIQEALGG